MENNRIRYRRNSGILANEAMGFEVDINGKNIIAIVSNDDIEWTVLLGNIDGEMVEVKWTEFLDIFNAMQKFVAEDDVIIKRLLSENNSSNQEE